MRKATIIFGMLVVLFVLAIIGRIVYVKFYPDATSIGAGLHGNSMTQYGLRDGDTYVEYINHPCLPGDICSFDCLVDKCTTPTGEHLGIKKLIKIENDCYWFQGNDDPWMENGHKVASWDSRVFGCLKPSEFKLEGVVKQPL